MGGFGSGRYVRTLGNQHTALKKWKEMYPGEPYPMARLRRGKKKSEFTSDDIEEIYKFPRKKRGPIKQKPRKDKGIKRSDYKQIRVNRKRKDANDEEFLLQEQEVHGEPITDEDLVKTFLEIQKLEAIEKEKKLLADHESSPMIVARRRQENTEYKRKRRSYFKLKRTQRIPADMICRLCSEKNEKNQQWVLVDFSDQQRGICKSCFDKVRYHYFNNDAKAFRAFLKLCKYDVVVEQFNERLKK